MQILRRLGALLSFGGAEISGWLILFLTILVTVDVTLRYVFRLSVPGTLEICRVLLVILVFLSFGEVQEKKENIRVEFLIEKLPFKVKAYLEVVAHLVALAFFLLLFWKSLGFFQTSLAVREFYAAAIRVPVYPAKAAIFIGCGITVLVLIKDIVASQLTMKRKSISGGNRESNQSNTTGD